MILRVGFKYRVRNESECLLNGWPVEDTIISKDDSLEKDFIGKSGMSYYSNGSVYGSMQKWEDDLIEEII